LTYRLIIRIYIEIDDEANKILSLDGIEETVIYMACVGRPAGIKN
jgi:hypothetical protein